MNDTFVMNEENSDEVKVKGMKTENLRKISIQAYCLRVEV